MSTASVDSLMVSTGASSYYDDAFRVVIDDHIEYLQNLSSTVSKQLTDRQRIVYEFDLMGLFYDLGISKDLWWIVLRINRLTSFTNLPDDLYSILIPTVTDIGKLLQVYNMSNRIK